MKLLEKNISPKTKVFVLFSFMLLVFLIACDINHEKFFWSPYNDLSWDKIGYYDAQFHTHPGLGDNEQYGPHQTIDRYMAEGYKILTLAGHDYHIPKTYMKTIYPWTKLSHIYENIKDVENRAEDNKTYGDIADEPYQDRDPVKIGMISVEGCEISGPHHMISLFNSCTKGLDIESESIQAIQDLGGLVYFAHPGRYIKKWGLTEYWYADLYQRFDAVIGQAVYNQKDRYPGDLQFYDKVIYVLGAERPVWLFGEDDMHRETSLGWNRNVILLNHFEPGAYVHDKTVPDIKEALKNGYFYLWKPSKQYNKRTFNIKDIEITNKKISIEIDKDELVNNLRWVTYNPDIHKTITLHYGNIISIRDLPDYCKFVRAEIEGVDGTIFTQPFYVKKVHEKHHFKNENTK